MQNQHTKLTIPSVQKQWTNWERIQENNSIYNSLKKNQIPRNKLNKQCKRPLQGQLQTTEARDQGRLQKVKRSPMLMDWQKEHSKNVYTTKTNPHVQDNSHQNPNDIHHRDWKIYPKVHLGTQKTMNRQGNTEQKRAMLDISQHLSSEYTTEP
jgi:hypothetical protein